MTIATKNGSVILKSGSVAQNCGCCGDSRVCVSFKSVGWAGRIVDARTSGSSFNFRNAGIINGDGYNGVQDANLGPYLTQFRLPLSTRWAASNCDLLLEVSESVVRVTLSLKVSAAAAYFGSVVLESDQVESFVSGEVIHVSQVVSNTVPNTVDEYNKPWISTVGSFYVKRDFVSGCQCLCHSNFYDASLPLTTPETYTLQFTNTAEKPAGPCWTTYSEYGADRLHNGGTYAAFLPLGGLRWFTNVLGLITAHEVAGCDAYMPRFESPIVLRKVSGTLYSYISDPIQVRPCVQVRYELLLCGIPSVPGSGSQDESPRLTCITIPSGAHVGSSPASSGTSIHTPAPMCVWEAEAYQEDPSAYADYRNAFVYVFGDFATVSPGGTYAPEPRLACGQPIENNISLAAGCLGTKCPPEEIELVISGSDSIFSCDGTYSLPLTGSACTPVNAAGTFSVSSVNFLPAGTASYGAVFSVNGWSFNFQVKFEPGMSPACDKVTVSFACTALLYSEFDQSVLGLASTNAYVLARRANGEADGSDAGRYRPICAGDSPIESYWENINLQANFGGGPSTFPALGDVSVTF